jgi:hypothetical protein
MSGIGRVGGGAPIVPTEAPASTPESSTAAKPRSPGVSTAPPPVDLMPPYLRSDGAAASASVSAASGSDPKAQFQDCVKKLMSTLFLANTGTIPSFSAITRDFENTEKAAAKCTLSEGQKRDLAFAHEKFAEVRDAFNKHPESIKAACADLLRAAGKLLS